MRVGSVIASSTRHVLGIGLQSLLIAAIIGAAIFAAATVAGKAPAGAHSVLAAKGGHSNLGSGPSSITLDQGVAALSLGSAVTFTTNVSGLTGTERALVYLKCMQGGNVVYGQLDLPGTTFVLGGGSSPWLQVGGTASCIGYLKAYGTHGGYDTIRVLAQTEAFSAN